MIIGQIDMMAYLVMMAPRLKELHRLLKSTGGIYLHCDPTASHYLKLLMDAVFGPEHFKTEIVWKRTSSQGNVSIGFGDVTDTILYHSKSEKPFWNQIYVPYSKKRIETKFASRDPDVRQFTTSDLRKPGVLPNLMYEYKGYNSLPNGWAISREKMDHVGTLYSAFFQTSIGLGRLMKIRVAIDHNVKHGLASPTKRAT